MTPSHSGRDGRRHSYYVSQAVVQGRPEEEGSVRRVPARDIDRVVLKAVRKALDVNSTPSRRGNGRSQPADDESAVRQVIRKVVVSRRSIALTLALPSEVINDPERNRADASEEQIINLNIPFEFVEKGGVTRIVVNGDVSQLFERTDNSLLKAVARAHAWKKVLLSGEARSVTELAKRAGVTRGYVTRILRLAFLAPDITEAILEGRQPPSLTVERLRDPIPLDWNEQRKLFATRR